MGVPESTIAALADVDVRTLRNWYRLAERYEALGLPEADALAAAPRFVASSRPPTDRPTEAEPNPMRTNSCPPLTAAEQARAETCLALVHYLALPYCRRHPHLADEFIGEGMLGLARAAALFDPERGIQFSTFAGNGIRIGLREVLRREMPLGYRHHRYKGQAPPTYPLGPEIESGIADRAAPPIRRWSRASRTSDSGHPGDRS